MNENQKMKDFTKRNIDIMDELINDPKFNNDTKSNYITSYQTADYRAKNNDEYQYNSEEKEELIKNMKKDMDILKAITGTKNNKLEDEFTVEMKK